MSTLGSRIRKSREALSLQQADIARLVGTKSDVISNWERDVNKPNADKLVLLCKALGVTLSFLLDYDGEELSAEALAAKELDDDVMLIAREARNLGPVNRGLLKQIIATMARAGEEAQRKRKDK